MLHGLDSAAKLSKFNWCHIYCLQLTESENVRNDSSWILLVACPHVAVLTLSLLLNIMVKEA